MSELTKPLLLSGDLFFGDASSDGSFATLQGPIEVDKMSVQPTANTVEQTSKARATYGAVRSSIILPGVTNVSISFMDVPAEILALMLMGDTGTITQSASSATDEAITAKLDKWVPTAYRNITSGTVVVQDVTDTTTYTEGTDYEIEYTTGMLKALSGGSISGDDVLHVDYDYGAVAGETVSISTQSQQTRGLKLVGKNLADNLPVELVLYSVKLRPTGEMDFMGASHVTADVTGVAEKPAALTTPGYWRYL